MTRLDRSQLASRLQGIACVDCNDNVFEGRLRAYLFGSIFKPLKDTEKAELKEAQNSMIVSCGEVIRRMRENTSPTGILVGFEHAWSDYDSFQNLLEDQQAKAA